MGKLSEIDIGLYYLKNRPELAINSFKDISDGLISTVRGYAAHTYLNEQGLTTANHLVLGNDPEHVWRLLFSRRVEYAFISKELFQSRFKALGKNADDVVAAFLVDDARLPNEMHMAASKQTDVALVNKVQQTLNQIKSDGTYQKILSRWLVKNRQVRQSIKH